MYYHIILTERCNLKCTYCYEKSMKEFDNGLDKKFDYDMDAPFDTQVQVEKLKKFLKPDDVLIFYGGEPLVMAEKIKEIMDNVNCRFMIQTNGVLFNQLPMEYVLRMDKMLVSIDGTEERDTKNKGPIHYKMVMKNLKKIREAGYKNEIVARMVVSEEPDIYEQAMHIVELINEGLYDSIHWQIDAGFYKFDYNREKFSKFVEEYNASIDELLDFWIYELRKGKVWKMYPFLGILARIKGWDKDVGLLPCGAGHSNFTITTDGHLSACPVMNSVKNLYCGSLDQGVTKKIYINECKNCPYVDVCGGRCLYWKEAKLWPKDGDALICKTIKHIIDAVRDKAVPVVDKLLEDGTLKKEDFDFEKYFGPEIIP